MSLVLEIENDEGYEFFQTYDRLSPLRKKIWRKLTANARSWTVNQPSQTKMAEWCDCSRSAISEAFREFKKYGWMWLQSRGFKKSKRIEIPISKQQIDIPGRAYFHSVKATYRATHTYTIKKENTSEDPCVPFKEISIPYYLQSTKISLKNKLKLSLVPEKIYYDALERAKYNVSKGKIKDCPENYVVGIALNMAMREKIKLDWVSFYKTSKKLGIGA